jgi:sortase A
MDQRTTNRPAQNGGLILRSVALRSVQTPTATRRRLRPTGKQVLRMVEGVVGASTILFWVFWLANGWGRDMVHAWQTRPLETEQAPASLPPVAVTAVPTLGRSLPVSITAPVATVSPAEPDHAAPAAAPIVDGRPSRLVIPTIGLASPITEVFLKDGTWQVADYAVGYHHGTGVPGSRNVVLAGHNGMRGAVFRKLESVQVGDNIWIDAGDKRFRYQVSATGKVWPDQVSIMQPTTEPILTLITCTNWDTERFVAIATLVEVAPANALQTSDAELAYGHEER